MLSRLLRVSRNLGPNLREAARKGRLRVRTWRRLPEIEAFNRLELASIQAFQLSRVRRIAAYAANNTSFYKERFREAGIEDPLAMTWQEFRRLRPLTRADMRNHLDDLKSREWPASELRTSATGGTTYSPVRYYMDWDAYVERSAATLAFDRWVGYAPWRRMAYLWGAPQDFPQDHFRARWNRALYVDRKLYLPTQSLDDAVLERYYHVLRRYRPALLQAYPTPLDILARFMLDRGYSLSIPNITTTAEPLLPSQAGAIEKAFGVHPTNWYGARELGRLATECSHHCGMHINCHGVLLETVDADRNPDGCGDILVTDLWNRGMPIIRYAIEDRGRVDQARCACGSGLPRLMEIAGRVTDVFLTESGTKIPGVAFTGRIVKESSSFAELQIIQHAYRHFEVLFVPGSEYREGVEKAIVQRIDEATGEQNQVEFRKVEHIPREPSGKLRFCKNLISI